MRRITQISSYSMRSSTCGSKAAPHFWDEVNLLGPFDREALLLKERICSFPVTEGVIRNVASRHFSHPLQRAGLLRFGIEALKRLPDHHVGRNPRTAKAF